MSVSGRIRFVVAVTIMFFSVASGASAVVITALGDTYVTSATSSLNFDSAQVLNVNQQSLTLLSFPLSALPTGTVPAKISKATLQLWVDSSSRKPTGSISVYAATGAWNTASVTYSTRPSIGRSPLVTQPLLGGTNYYLEIDVTAQVKNWIASPASNLGLVVVAASSTPTVDVAFNSKENTVTSHAPILDVTMTSGGSVAVCVEGSSSNDAICSCSTKTISQVITVGSCLATSDAGTCTAHGFSGHAGSCCVCAQ